MQDISALLSPQRCLCRVEDGSKKRLFERIADTIGGEIEAFHAGDLVAGMLAREKLGSTALGGGIAIPHCRLNECDRPRGALITLKTPIDFDAPDDEQVDLLFALVVPSEATQEHLNILADLARLFSQVDFCDALRACESSLELHAATLDWCAKAA